MTVNFSIEDHYALSFDGRHIDLHNNYHFIGHNYDSLTRQLTLSWTKSSGEWVRKDEFQGLTLIHAGVYYMDITFNDNNGKITNDDICLGDLTFFPSTERTINDQLLDQKFANEGDDILYIFESGHYIRIGCDRITLIKV